MERHHAQLESQTGHHKHQAEHQHLVLDLTGVDGLENLADIQRARGTVHHGQAIEQEATGHGAQHKILHGRFRGRGVVAAQCHQGIARECQQLKAQVDHQEVVARDHDEHAEQGEHGQREQFAPAQHVAVGSIGAAVHQGDHHGHGGKALEPVAHGVAHHHVAKTIEGVTAAGVHALQGSHHGEREHGQYVGAGAARAVDTQIDQRNHAGHGQQHNFGVNR